MKIVKELPAAPFLLRYLAGRLGDGVSGGDEAADFTPRPPKGSGAHWQKRVRPGGRRRPVAGNDAFGW